MKPRVYALTGPTGVGKTALSLKLAERLGAEIVSCDSRQIYRRLDIGTAKPNEEERRRVRHHFIDELNLDEPWSAGLFAERAESRISDILKRDRLALVVGGSTLYLHALTNGLAPLPEADLDLREELNAVAETETGRRSLFEELERVDPESAATLDPTKSQRLVRFVEIYRSTGRTASSFWKRATPPPFDVRVVVLNRDRGELYARIDSRVDQMLSDGLMSEVQALHDEGYSRESTPALHTIGYKEPLSFLSGETDWTEMVDTLKRNSRRYAKRQLTWFRRSPHYAWRHAEDSVSEILAAFE